MERPCDVVRSFGFAQPLKCGFLRFPTAAPSILKKKGGLEKAGEYFLNVSKAKKELTLMLKISVPFNFHEKALCQEYKEEKFMWVWSEETSDKMMSWFKNKIPGMCRHTFAIWQKNLESPAAMGVCDRGECETLTVEDFLMRYLKRSYTQEQRHAAYAYLLKKFPVDREIVLFDPEFVKDKMIVTPVVKKTIRHLTKSNGEKLSTITIQASQDSSIERVKNAMRPILLYSQRASTSRMMVVQQIAHSCGDTLGEWYTVISANLQGVGKDGWNDEWTELSKLEGPPVGSWTERIKLESKDMDQKRDLFEMFGHGVKRYEHFNIDSPISDIRQEEKVVAEISSWLTIEEMFSCLVQKHTAAHTSNYLDRYVLGAIDTYSAKEVKEVKTVVNPLNKDGSSQKYAIDCQTSLLRAVTETKLPEDTISKYVNMFTSFLSGKKPVSSAVKRGFTIEKTFSVKYDKEGYPEEFNVNWMPVDELSGLKETAETKVNVDGGKTKKFDKISMKVTKVSEWKSVEFDVKGKKQSFTRVEFESLLLNDCNAANKFLYGALLEKTSQYSFYKENSMSSRKEVVFEKLVVGTRDELMLNAIRLFKHFLKKPGSFFQKDIVYQGIHMISNFLSLTNSYILTTMCFHLLQDLMIVGKVRRSTFGFQCVVVNEASKVFASAVETFMRRDKGVASLALFKLAREIVENLVKSKTSCVSTSNLHMVQVLSKCFEELGKEKVPAIAVEYTEQKYKLEALVEFTEGSFSVLNLRKQATAIERVEAMFASVESITKEVHAIDEKLDKEMSKEVAKGLKASRAEKMKEIDSYVESVKAVQVPYAKICKRNEKTEVIEELTWSTGSYNITIEDGKGEKLKCTLKPGYVEKDKPSMDKDIKTECKEITYVDTVNPSLSTPSLTEVKNSNIDFSKLDAAVAALGANPQRCFAEASYAVKGTKATGETLVTLTVIGSAEKLYGEQILESKPDLAETWTKDIVKSVANGINIAPALVDLQPLKVWGS